MKVIPITPQQGSIEMDPQKLYLVEVNTDHMDPVQIKQVMATLNQQFVAMGMAGRVLVVQKESTSVHELELELGKQNVEKS